MRVAFFRTGSETAHVERGNIRNNSNAKINFNKFCSVYFFLCIIIITRESVGIYGLSVKNILGNLLYIRVKLG